MYKCFTAPQRPAPPRPPPPNESSTGRISRQRMLSRFLASDSDSDSDEDAEEEVDEDDVVEAFRDDDDDEDDNENDEDREAFIAKELEKIKQKLMPKNNWNFVPEFVKRYLFMTV